jgi:uncharacterized protein (DUF58 family)
VWPLYISDNDKVGVFYDSVEQFITPKKGRDHVLFIVRELLTAQPKKKGTRLGEALRRFNNSTRQQCISLIVSDFLDPSFEDSLKVAGKKHDIIGIKAYDKMDIQLPDAGLLEVEDAETGNLVLINSDSYTPAIPIGFF